MRKLLLLPILTLLAGAHAGPAAPVPGAAAHADALAPADHAAAQPPLAGLGVGTALALPAAEGAARTPTRPGRTSADPLARIAAPLADTHISQRTTEFLAYAQRLRIARANVPVSYGTPPPASAT